MGIDYHRYAKAVMDLNEGRIKAEGDLYLQAARIASGDPELTVTPEQRRQLKQAAFGVLYGQQPLSFSAYWSRERRK